ncbi:hypothetical protein VSS74_06460 [Conexibacter stalactiti]|uniref:Roadblock/LAMTOR2 domain-containing protein n=1 Tax=Conexibacter stalactiti TaxID=1940611 RepID=A0ABU4HL18_9ACTN|nr:hypothetical protein [Conexibacter stalactiti]MDW5593967.1 hypothetical protein [Conexibacter stalactiti]MEC5034609.1 hypothetical protein [Conexibacter stalactiti]
MPAILTPALALRHLRQLSTDVRAAAVLAADGRVLAVDGAAEAALGEHARALAGLVEPGGELLVRLDRNGDHAGSALAIRAPAPGDDAAPGTLAVSTLVLAVGPHALLALLRHDAAVLLGDLGAEHVHDLSEHPEAAPPASLSSAEPLALWDASRRVQLLGRTDSAAATAIFAGLGLLGAGKS